MIHHKRHKRFKKLKEAQAETDKSAAVSNEESKAVALKAQQAAIKEEASANNLSDTSQEAQEIQEAKKKHKQKQIKVKLYQMKNQKQWH